MIGGKQTVLCNDCWKFLNLLRLLRNGVVGIASKFASVDDDASGMVYEGEVEAGIKL